MRGQSVDLHTLKRTDPMTYRIIGAAIEVHKALGPQLLERTYETALCIELELQRFRYERQRQINVAYKGQPVGEFFADKIVESRVVLELKAVANLLPVHNAQMIAYLKMTGFPIGLLINFNVPLLVKGVRRFAN